MLRLLAAATVLVHRGSSNNIKVAFGGRHATKSHIAHTQRRSSTEEEDGQLAGACNVLLALLHALLSGSSG